MFKQKHLLFLLVFVFTCQWAFPQISVSASPSVGCAPQTVNFTGPPGTGILWQFGDGGTSNNQNPGHNYLTAGNYVVTYTSSAGTATTLVKIFPAPVANFTFNIPANHCAAETVTFVNTSTSPTVITGYQWNFGNGVPSAVANPTYTYPSSGSFTVNLTITDANNCSNQVSIGPINVSSPPNIIISTNPSPAAGCTAPFICAFSGSNCTSGSPIGNSMTFNWGFGNGQTSGQQNPGNITFNTTGSYITTLTVTDNNNCSATHTIPVTVSQPVVAVTLPTFVCIYDTLFANDHSTAAFTQWSFSDGGLITMPSYYFNNNWNFAPAPYKNIKKYAGAWNGCFATPGIKTVTITAFGGGTCTAVQVKTISVESPSAVITATPPTFSCNSPFICPYFGTSTPTNCAFSWSVSNCNNATFTSNATNPTFTITQGSLNPYTIYPYCIPSVLLKVTTPNGCTNTVSYMSDTLRRPTAWFNKNKKEGCVPLSVNFRDSSQAYLPPYPFSIVGYTWNNGATPPTIISGPPPTFSNVTFNYTTTGTYTPYLIIQTAQGCIDTSFIDTVRVVSPAPLSFSFSPSTVCPGQTVTIANTSPSLSTIQHWHVDSDDGYFSGCVSDPNPGWVFTHIGVHSFTLEAWKHSCNSSTTIPQQVTVNGPIVQGRFQTDCSNRKTVTFATEIQDAQNTTLNFGDGSPVYNIPGALMAVTNNTVSHTYANTGDYTVTLVSSNGSGTCSPYTYTMLVQVRDVQAAIVASSTVCVGIGTVFSAATSTDVLVSCNSTGYTWYFDNDPPRVTTTPTIPMSFATAGTHTITLEVKDINSCSNSKTDTIRASQPAPSFTMVSPICLSTGTVQFNNTTSQVPDPISGYNWSFGDGGISTVTNPIHNYINAAVPSSTFAVILTATNSLGCVNSTSLVMQVNNPNAQLSALPGTSICVGQSITISAPPGYPQYTINCGDGSVYTGTSTVIHSYTSAGPFTASVIIVDNGACSNSSSLTFSVQSYPVPNFTIISPGAQSPTVACLGNNITFSSTSTSNPTYSFTYNWDIGNGSNILPIPAIVAAYSTPSVYLVTLTVSTIPNGCKSIITKTVAVYSATANLNLNKDTICLGKSIIFNLKDTSNVFSWTWDFADGDTLKVLAPSLTPTVSHSYTNTLAGGTKTVSLIYYSSNYMCRHFAQEVIDVMMVNANFNRNNEILRVDSVHCIGSTDQFSSPGFNPSNSTFVWDFGDGHSSFQQSPSNTYTAPGVYPVTFSVVQQPQGCMGYSIKNMTINPLPTVTALPDSACKDQPFTLKGSGPSNLSSYTWSPSQGVLNPHAIVTTATSSISQNYTLSVLDTNRCGASAIASIYVQLPPKNTNWDTSIVVGQSVPINGNAGTNFTYTWSPTTDLSCIYCSNPVSTSTNNITYTVNVKDAMGCFTATSTYSIIVEDKSSVDVPTAFTPNGDGTNDVIYVNGWGIKKLKYFRIFNRWGQLLFESNDIKTGWDGTFNGIQQNMETYVYQVSCETYIDKDPVMKTGSFKLIR